MKINELEPHDLNCNVFDVYTYDGLSMQELLCQFFTKINECVTASNNTLDLVEWLTNEGLSEEVAKQLLLWYNDGSLEEIINNTLFENLNKKIDNNKIELDRINNIKKLNSDLYSKFQYKLRKGQSVSIACMGDSMTYGSDFVSEDKLQPNGKTDNGVSHVATRSPIQYPSEMGKFLNSVYNNKITVKNMGYSGDGTKLGYEHWNASGCDIVILSYGINDSSNSNIDYMGNVEEYLSWYRKIIERELLNGTACIILSPTKQLLVSVNDEDSRASVDIFASATKMLANEYNIPWIDGHVMLEGYGAKHYSDTTHLNSVGYKILGTRMASIFIGEGANKPYKINGYDFLGSNPLLDNFKLNNALLIKNAYYPTPSETVKGGGNAILIQDGQSVIYSFYCEQPNTVVIPNLYTSSKTCNIEVILDNGTVQADYQNYFTSTKNLSIDWENNEKSTINVSNNDLVDFSQKCYTGKNFMYTHQPHLIITSRGWHTIEIKTNFGNNTDSCTWYGLEFMDFNTFNDKIMTIKDLTLYNCVPYDDNRKPIMKIRNNGNIYLEGTIKDITNTTDRLLSFDPKYAPQTHQTFIVALSSSTSGGIGTVTVTSEGNIYLNYKSQDLANFTTLFNISWNVKNG